MDGVLLAPDKFKGTLSAAQVADALSAGIRSVRPGAELITVPIADGGDGLLDAFAAAGYQRVAVRAADALGVSRPTSYRRRGERAVIELATICGLAALEPVAVGSGAPLIASSRGVGEVIAAAIGAGCRQIVLGIGGSASTDGGAGMAQALGASITDARGVPIGPGGGALNDGASLDLAGLRAALRGVRIEVACDVDNPLTGPDGAAATYGPQKGADRRQVAALDAALGHWADLVAARIGHDDRAVPGAGAAGGVGFAAVALLGAVLRSGAPLVLDLMDFSAALAGAGLVITGEGSLDEQTLRGKAPAAVARAARDAGVAVIAVAGRCELAEPRWRAAGFEAVYSLTEAAGPGEDPRRDAAALLRRLGARIATDHRARIAAGRR